MSTSRPWWVSEGPVDGGVDPTEDPLDAHRAARRGPESPGSSGSGTDETSRGGAEADPTADATHPGSEICGVCPVCAAARILGETRPELLAHLTEVAKHLSAAMRTLLETSVESRAGDRGRDPDDRGVRRIDLD